MTDQSPEPTEGGAKPLQGSEGPDQTPRFRFNVRNVEMFLLCAFAMLVLVGIGKGVYEVSRPGWYDSVVNAPTPSRSPEVFHTEWPSESGYLEYYRSLGINAGEKSLKAGYATCSDLAILGVDGTYAELRSLGSKDQSDQLLYASIHYLCNQYESEYQEWRIR